MERLTSQMKGKLKTQLEASLGRKAKKHEVINSEKDPALCMEVLFNTVEDLEKRLKQLEIKMV